VRSAARGAFFAERLQAVVPNSPAFRKAEALDREKLGACDPAQVAGSPCQRLLASTTSRRKSRLPVVSVEIRFAVHFAFQSPERVGTETNAFVTVRTDTGTNGSIFAGSFGEAAAPVTNVTRLPRGI